MSIKSISSRKMEHQRQTPRCRMYHSGNVILWGKGWIPDVVLPSLMHFIISLPTLYSVWCHNLNSATFSFRVMYLLIILWNLNSITDLMCHQRVFLYQANLMASINSSGVSRMKGRAGDMGAFLCSFLQIYLGVIWDCWEVKRNKFAPFAIQSFLAQSGT